MGNDHLDCSCSARASSMTHGALAAATGLILRLPAWVIGAFQSAQPRPGPDSSDRLNCRPRLTR
jgi:hypothetical protein